METRGPHRGKTPNAGWERLTKDTVPTITGTSFSQCSNVMPVVTAKCSGEKKNNLGKQRVYFSYNSSSQSSQQDSHNGVRNLKSLVTSHSSSSAQ